MELATALKSSRDGAFARSAALRHLEAETADRLSYQRSLQRFRAGQPIFYEGEPCETMFEVVGGVVRLVKLLPDGRRQITGFVRSGHFLGLSVDDTYVYMAEAVTDATLCRYPRQNLERALKENPELARKLLGMVCGELAAAQDQMLLLGRKTATEKLASFLIQLLQQQQEDGENTAVLQLPMTRSDIGDYLGLAMETVSRIITELRQLGLIDLDHPVEMVLRDIDGLRELAGQRHEEHRHRPQRISRISGHPRSWAS